MTALDSATAAIASVRRASAADRNSAMNFDVQMLPLAGLAAIADDWRALSAHAIEPNAFYEADFALAAAPLLGADIMAGLVWSRTPRQLVGLFPVRIDRARYGVPFAVLVNWTHAYAPLGTPLVDREMAEPVIAAWLDHVAGDVALPDLMLMRLLPETGPFATALASVLARHGCQQKSFDRHQRALLLPGDGRADYLQRTMSGKRQRNMRRRQRQLEELGAVAVVEAKGSDAIARGLDDFLTLEAKGWKGRAGTAAMNNAGVRRFMQQAITALGGEGKVLIHRLLVGGKPIAATIALKSGNAAWGWKVAYDEQYAAYSPGVLLVGALTESILAEPAIVQADSCATSTDTMAGQLWAEQLALADRFFTAGPNAEISFALATRLEALRRAAIAAAKSARDHMRGR